MDNVVNSKEQSNRGKKALKSGIWYTVSSISVKAILIISTPIFTRMMSTADFGLSATFTTWFTLLNVICSLNLWYSIGRAKLDFPGKLEEFVGSVQLLAFLFAFIVEAISFLFFESVCVALDLNGSLLISLYIYLLLYPAVQLTQSKMKYLYNYKANIAITIYTTITTVLISLILVLLMPSNAALGKSLGAVVSTGFLSAFIWIKAISKNTVKINLEYWKYGLKISVPLILNSISLNILAQSDRVFITKFCGTHYTGIYSLAYSYAILINIILNAANEAWLPWFHDTFYDEGYDEIKKNVKPLIVFGCWFGVGCIAIAPEAVALLGGDAYAEGVWAVPPVTLGIVCSYIFQHYEHIELHLKKTWFISVGTVIAAATNILLNYLFVKKYGFVAAAYTTLVCYLLLMILHHYISRWVLKIHLYHDKFMYSALFVTTILAVVFMILYKSFWLWRWILIFVISLIYLYSNRKIIDKAVKGFMKRKANK